MKNIYLILFALSLFLKSFYVWGQQSPPPDQECFMILAGKNTTVDKSVMIAYNNENTVNETSYLKKYPGTSYDSTDYVLLGNGDTIPQKEYIPEWFILQTKNGVLKGNAVAVNEFKVAIGGGISLARDRNLKARKADPLKKNGLTGKIRYIVLQRARSAREAVRLLGQYYNEYGISTASGIAIADKNEIWYMETGGGTHWAAIKLPPDICWIQGNSYRIGYIQPDNDDVLASPGLQDFARQKGLWEPGKDLFNFAEVFGGRIRKKDSVSNRHFRRIWRAINILAPSQEVSPDQYSFPTRVRPDKKISTQNLMTILRDEYRDTKFYPYSADTIMMLDTIQQLDTLYEKDRISQIDTSYQVDTLFRIDSSSLKERPIASSQTVHSSIIQIREGFHYGIASIIWTALGSPVTSPYVPFYFGIKEVPEPYDSKTPDSQKAFSYFHQLAKLYYQNPAKYKAQFPEVFYEYQQTCFEEQRNIDKNVFRLYMNSQKMASLFLTVSVDGLGQEAMDVVKSNIESLSGKENQNK